MAGHIVTLRALGLALALALVPVTLAAQKASPLADGTAVGASVGRVSASDDQWTSVALNVTRLRQNRVGFELSLATIPMTVPLGMLVLAPDVGAAYNVSLPGATLLVKGGASLLLAGSPYGFAGGVGGYFGAGAIVRLGPRVGLRLDVTQRYLSTDGDVASRTLPLLGMSMGLTSIPGAR